MISIPHNSSISPQELGLIRKPANIVSTISDERGEELVYAGMRITDVFKEDIGVGGVVSLLWSGSPFHEVSSARQVPAPTAAVCVQVY